MKEIQVKIWQITNIDSLSDAWISPYDHPTPPNLVGLDSICMASASDQS
jgi:hypothetical protein